LSKETVVPKALEFLSHDNTVEPQKITSCLSGKGYQESLERDEALAIDLGINSTPTVFLNGRKISVRSIEDLRAAMNAALANSQPTTPQPSK
jgi:protein-disulfide isomerase